MNILYNNMVNNRSSGLDLIRALAIFSVIGGSSYQYTSNKM